MSTHFIRQSYVLYALLKKVSHFYRGYIFSRMVLQII